MIEKKDTDAYTHILERRREPKKVGWSGREHWWGCKHEQWYVSIKPAVMKHIN